MISHLSKRHVQGHGLPEVGGVQQMRLLVLKHVVKPHKLVGDVWRRPIHCD